MSEAPLKNFQSLDAGKVTATIERLCRRVEQETDRHLSPHGKEGQVP